MKWVVRTPAALRSQERMLCRSAIKKLYESFAVGRISAERFDSLLADYEAEQKELDASVSVGASTTMNIYAHATREAKRSSARLLDKVVSGG